MRIKKPGQTLNNIVTQVRPELALISDLESKVKRTERWSKREVLGHLLDSATVNRQRFVEAQLKDDLIFNGYDQDQWVTLQCYQEITWRELVNLWADNNLLIAHLINRIPRDKLSNYSESHNLDKIAWKQVPSNKPTTLRYLIWDYIAHMEHHLRKIMPGYQPVVIDNY